MSVKIDGGFFWAHGPGAPVETGPDDQGVVSNCVFMTRPRWWQLHRWWFAWRMWLSLPHNDTAEAAILFGARTPTSECRTG